MTHLDDLISLLLGFGVPAAISYFKASHWTDRQAMILSLVICGCAGALSSIGTHALVYHTNMTLDDWAENVLVVFAAATAFYKLYFQNTRTNATLETKGPFELRNADGTPAVPPREPGETQ